jgi:hypothetical protein
MTVATVGSGGLVERLPTVPGTLSKSTQCTE